MSAVITPTPGRVVWFYPAVNDNIPALAGQPLAAMVAAVHGDRRVNLSVIDAYGNHHSRQNVHLSQPDDDAVGAGKAYATWMPYQVSQAGIKPAGANPVSTESTVVDEGTEGGAAD